MFIHTFIYVAFVCVCIHTQSHGTHRFTCMIIYVFMFLCVCMYMYEYAGIKDEIAKLRGKDEYEVPF